MEKLSITSLLEEINSMTEEKELAYKDCKVLLSFSSLGILYGLARTYISIKVTPKGFWTEAIQLELTLAEDKITSELNFSIGGYDDNVTNEKASKIILTLGTLIHNIRNLIPMKTLKRVGKICDDKVLEDLALSEKLNQEAFNKFLETHEPIPKTAQVFFNDMIKEAKEEHYSQRKIIQWHKSSRSISMNFIDATRSKNGAITFTNSLGRVSKVQLIKDYNAGAYQLEQ